GDILESDGATAFAAAAYTNTTVVVGGYGFDFDISHADVANTVTVFTFTTDALDIQFDWTINGFNAMNDGATTLSNVSILDVRELGITDVTAFTFTQAGADTVITSNDGSMDFEIILTGVTAADLDNDNFHFAV